MSSEVESPELRHVHERLLHPLRRRLAVRRLRSNSRPGLVLFLCHGNVCRSPFAEATFRRQLAGPFVGAFDATSAGFVVPGRRSPPEAIAAAERFDVDLSAHRSRLVTGDMVRAAMLVVVVSADQGRGISMRFGPEASPVLVLGDLDPLPIDTRTIRDPWNCPEEVFDAVYARIHRCVRALVGIVTTTSQ